MKFNLLKIIELPLRSRTKFCDGPPSEGRERFTRMSGGHSRVSRRGGWCPFVSRERFMRMSGGHSKASRVAIATGD